MYADSYLPPAITSALIFAFLVFSFKRTPYSVQFRALSILCVNTLWWHLSWVFLYLTRDEALAHLIAKIGHVGILALPLTFHYFYAALVGQESKLRITKICIYIFFLVCLGLTDWVIKGVNLFPWGYYPIAGSLHPIFLLVTAYFIIYGLIINYENIKYSTNSLKKRTLQICQVAGIIYGFGAVDFLVNYKISEFYPFGFLFSIIFIIIISYAVINFEIFTKEERLLEDLRCAQQAQRDGEIRLGEMATQVAHDLRSPLAALETALTTFDSLSADHQLLLREIIARIREISSELLMEAKAIRGSSGHNELAQGKEIADEFQFENPLSISSSHLICDLIEGILFEARVQYKARTDLKFLFDSEDYKNVLVRVQASEFKRVLSNLINNSVEAIKGPGQVSISLTKDPGALKKNGQILVVISDTGAGIPSELLKQLGKRGLSFGKKEGNGLGLYHAILMVRKWGWDLEIKSEVGVGTRITLTLQAVDHKVETQEEK